MISYDIINDIFIMNIFMIITHRLIINNHYLISYNHLHSFQLKRSQGIRLYERTLLPHDPLCSRMCICMYIYNSILYICNIMSCNATSRNLPQRNVTARRCVLPGKFTWRLSIILQHAQTPA